MEVITNLFQSYKTLKCDVLDVYGVIIHLVVSYVLRNSEISTMILTLNINIYFNRLFTS